MKKFYFIFLLLLVLNQRIQAQDSSSFKPCRFYFRVAAAYLTQPKAFAPYFQNGFGAGVGLNLYASPKVQIKLNADLINVVFGIQKYVDNRPELRFFDIESIDPLLLTLSPEFKYIPIKTRTIFPYGFVGLKTLYNLLGGDITKSSKRISPTEEQIFPNSFRFVPYVGLGTEIYLSNQLNLCIDLAYHMEIFENTKPSDPFFEFQKLENLKMNFVQLNVGIGLKPFR